MKRRTIEVPGLHHGGAPFPIAAVVDRFLQSSAVHGMDPNTGEIAGTAEDQAEQVFHNVRLILEAAGSGLDDVVAATVFIADESVRRVVDPVWVKTFPDPRSRPTRHTVLAPLRRPMLIQVQFNAVLEERQ
ncbi:RidA family protein [Pseudonocardia asaccharolytica]|uniref:2-iminobutanoate/2-iminopropanoate deaminase n=1 Tax=Pseudonocardia asaccharolytica DSM 44247 = NBRC 16224 TaxID=1123024 RepID=A0A511CXN6_9PSEU|nr:RidA family protein [Pseudonocardia asaccharolytica]GEL17237.1 2-iminobutanoate/2-iminopropanoate deaminase [Pseudonocardia asaccharolytica DSM 44247 = NBRC 16224]